MLILNLEIFNILKLVTIHFLQILEARFDGIAVFRWDRVLKILDCISLKSHWTYLDLDMWFKLQGNEDLSILVDAAVSQ
jgi:hypothetical protein